MQKLTQQFRINNCSLTITFRKVMVPGSPKYFVVASRGTEELPPFEIKYDYNKWKAVPPLPFWVEGEESTLIEYIKKMELDLMLNLALYK